MNNLVEIGIFILIEIILNRMVNLAFRMMSKKHNTVHLRFLKSAANFLVALIVVYCLAQQFEVTKDISRVLLQSSSLIVAIATFAAQQALSNVISGFSLSVSKPYNVDDKIKVVQGSSVVAEGMVKDITIRHTVIRQFNGESCIVPNSVMDQAIITNTNYNGDIGNFFEIEISYDSNIEEAMAVLQRLCIEHPLTLNTSENGVFVKGYTQNGVVLKTTVWTKNLDHSFQACSDIRVKVLREFKTRNIQVPYQTVTVYSQGMAEKDIQAT